MFSLFPQRANKYVSGTWIVALPALLISLHTTAQKKDSLTNTLFGRKYKTGDSYRYLLTTTSWQNEKLQGTTLSACALQVVTDSAGVAYDEIKWLSKKEIKGKDTTDKTAEAIQVAPYRISLDAKGKLSIPAITVASMTGEITDFNTFFVAVSPQLGIAKLSKKNDRYHKAAPVTGDFSNGRDIVKGSDCLDVSLLLQDIDKNTATLLTSFLPPTDSCLQYLAPDMALPVVKDTINNFQMVRPFGNNKYNVLYGREYFYITSIIRRSDGKITGATMHNLLSLKIKLYCGEDYTNCQSTIPFTIERRLKLEILE